MVTFSLSAPGHLPAQVPAIVRVSSRLLLPCSCSRKPSSRNGTELPVESVNFVSDGLTSPETGQEVNAPRYSKGVVSRIESPLLLQVASQRMPVPVYWNLTHANKPRRECQGCVGAGGRRAILSHIPTTKAPPSLHLPALDHDADR